MVNQVNNNRSGQYLSGVNGHNNDDDSSDLSGASRVDNAKDNVAALRESIMSSKDAMGANRTNSVTHDFDDFETSFL